ncbi:ADR379Cp [Eremothecium gossypii ATCC 10895]|uniref:ADR379Cp n=1 Tax=Eremothecium gossypii (strain ATCC 10895 / CBS 109.51 / FGSC 9923 / NRRL Y-1056) TaxID=284811 RepID=Q758Z8_EREGS|nr:ADR379Cp [Eremothecium gossypii ATCC 10895]AAS52299.2 ADR379Cp [Eremothecium gossypii ATCC 10895]AEY96596.1 FADR379Cp [Eremothecium gossypii FDAG1]
MPGDILGLLEAIIDPDKTATSDSGLAAQGNIQVEPGHLLRIGRNLEECDVVLAHPSVSSVHCTVWGIQFDGESVPMCYIRDCSLNGTYVNGQSLLKGESYMLQDGDVISIPNDCEFRFSAVSTCYSPLLFEQLGIKRRVGEWEITPQVVGSGTFGQVLVAERKSAHSKHRPLNYAVKVIRMKREALAKEASILVRLNHPNVIKVHDTFVDENDNIYIFEDLVAGGDLFSYLAKKDCLAPISETEALVIVYQILQALKFLHSKGIVHRDLKLDNILLCTPEPCSRIVLADFGIAKDLPSTRVRMHTIVGTPEYCAPEVGFRVDRNSYRNFSRTASMEQQGYDFKCDLWSLGVMTHIMLTGISPFYGDGTEASIIRNVKIGKLNFGTKQWVGVSDTAKSFVRQLLEVNAEKRMSVQDCFKHPWIAKHRSHLERIYNKKIVAGGTSLTKNIAEIDWKRKMPKAVVLSPPKIQKKKMRK